MSMFLEFAVEGIKTNIRLHRDIMADEKVRYRAVSASTYLEESEDASFLIAVPRHPRRKCGSTLYADHGNAGSDRRHADGSRG